MVKSYAGKGFTLVELLVVIAIIGILTGVLLSTFGGATESARSAKCLSNMRNLAAACQNYGMSAGHYPLAASLEYSELDESQGIRRVKELFHERKGWVSWASEGAYNGAVTSSKASKGWFKSAYEDDDRVAKHCLTNGAIWKYVSANAAVYTCPAHIKKAKRNVNWSYAMNAYFRGDVTMSCKPFDSTDAGVEYGRLARADRRLLFAELPFADELDETLEASDPILQYKGLTGYGGTPDRLHFNHIMGKKRCAHVAYADGHVDRLIMPAGGISNGESTELLQWLCEGKDISFDGAEYRKMDD